MSLEAEMSTDVNNLPETSDSNSIDQNELVDKILAEMNSKSQNTSEDINPNNPKQDNIHDFSVSGSISIPDGTEPSIADPNRTMSAATSSKILEVSSNYIPNITNIPYRIIVYSTIFSIFLYLLFTSKLVRNILQQIPYMYHEDNRTVLGGFLSVGLFGFISLIGNYYVQLQS